MAATGLAGVLHGATTPNASVGDRFKNATVEGVTDATVTGILKGVPKLLHPFNTVGEYRAAKIAEAQGSTVSGDKLVEGLQKIRAQVPSTELQAFDNMTEQAKAAYTGKDIAISDAIELNKHLNDAFLASGKVGKSAKALVESTLGSTLRGEIKTVAPDVSQANQLFKMLYGASKNVRRFAYPAAIAGGAGAGGAALMNAVLRK